MKTRVWPFLFIAAAVGLAGCAGSSGRNANAKPDTSFRPLNFVGESVLPRSVRRVVLLPVHGGQFAPPEACEYLDPIFSGALEQKMRFEVVILSREQCAKSFGSPDLGSTDALPPDFLTRLGTDYSAKCRHSSSRSSLAFPDSLPAPDHRNPGQARHRVRSPADLEFRRSLYLPPDPAVVAAIARRFYLKQQL